MDGDDQLPMGSGRRHPGEMISEHIKSHGNDGVLRFERDGEARAGARTESGGFEAGVTDGIACSISHAQTSAMSEVPSLNFANSCVPRHSLNKVDFREIIRRLKG